MGDDWLPVGPRALQPAQPPDVVTWAKKAQNGVLFVQRGTGHLLSGGEEVHHDLGGRLSRHGVRLLALLGQAGSRPGATYPANARGTDSRRWRGTPVDLEERPRSRVMLGLRRPARRLVETLLDAPSAAAWCSCRRATRTVVLPALRHGGVLDRRGAVDSADGDRGPRGRPRLHRTRGDPKVRVGTLAIPLDTIENVDLTPAAFEAASFRFSRWSRSATALRRRRRPTRQKPVLGPLAVAAPDARGHRGQSPRHRHRLRDRVSGRFVGYAPRQCAQNPRR